ncbi:MAG: prepilin-type N-terminal cleavage/methylation domain-containing protein [Deltaproteobacteria bacterium]|nr:prepilin-type N-terminal cleavage/methylation domain-containing protein [Deltaproteobacteria bacterium]
MNATRDKGFTIIELVIAMAILGVLTAGIFTLYNSQHRVTHIEADVVDVQQNLRMSLESVSKDIRMAGFALTNGANPVAAAGNNTGLGSSDTMTINAAGTFAVATRLDADLSAAVTSGTPLTFTVLAGDVSLFTAGDAIRIIHTGDKSEPAATVFTVNSVNAAGPTITATPAANAGAVEFKRGFLVVKTGDSAPDTFPNTVQYCLGPDASCASAVACPAGSCLMRIVNGSASANSIVATNIQNMQLSYVLDDGTTTAAPADLSAVRDILVTVSGQTAATAGLSGAAKTREMTVSAKIRNR